MSDIKPIIVSVSYTYTPEEYLRYCEEEEVEPTQEDFEGYITFWIEGDFGYNLDYDIKRIGE